MDDVENSSRSGGKQPEAQSIPETNTASDKNAAEIMDSVTENITGEIGLVASQKMEELLRTFQTQLDLHQKQLELLRDLANSRDWKDGTISETRSQADCPLGPDTQEERRS